MVHLELVGYAPPGVHQEFIKKINDMKYECEGENRKGEFAPFVSEVKYYDIRIPDDIKEEFLRDINARPLTSPFGTLKRVHKGWRKYIYRFLYWLVEKINPLKQPKPAEGKQKYKLGSWHNFYCLGEFTDDSNKNVLTGEEREVL